MKLAGQVALVTGGAGGIGAAVCRGFAEEGAAVAINYHGGAEQAEALASELRALGRPIVAIQADVSREGEVVAMFDRIEAELGRIDVVVPNAGIQRDAPVEDMTVDAWNLVLQVNLTGQFLCAREAIRRFQSQQPSAHSRALGKVICMSSVHEVIPWAHRVNYTASKGGIRLMMQTLAQEVAGRRIRVNAIAPGAIATAINRATWSDPDQRAKLLELIPYGRIGEPEDVAKAAIWLASDDSDYVTGTTVYVDGGMSLYPGFMGNG